MWHELVLHGVGGCTVAEAKENVSYVEYQSWIAYLKKRGSLNPGPRLEGGFALVAHLICVAAGIKHKTGRAMQISDFMPHAEHEEELTVHKVMTALHEALGGTRGK